MSLFGKFKMLEQRVNQLTLNQPNSLDVSFFGSDKLKRLQERIENLSQYDSHMFSMLREENQHHAQDIASLKTTCNELRTTTTRTQIDSRNTLNALERHISRLQKSVDEIESKLASSHHKLPEAQARSTPVIRHEPPEERAHYTPARKHSYRTDSEDDHDDGSWAWDEYPGSDFEGA